MAEKFSFFIRQTLGKVSPETMLFICLCASFVTLVVGLIIWLCAVNVGVRKRLWCIIFFAGITTIQGAHALMFGHSFSYVLFTIGVNFILSLPIFFVSSRKRKLKKEQKELAEFLDRNAQSLIGSESENGQGDSEQFGKQDYDFIAPPKTNIPVEKLSVKEKQSDKEDKPDFTHVKNVVERLAYFPLTPFDKRQVKDLEVAMKRIESGENTAEAKNKINDGLSSLLKIMSKYGV